MSSAEETQIKMAPGSLNRFSPRKLANVPQVYERVLSVTKSEPNHHLTPVRMTSTKRTGLTSVGEDVERQELLCTVVGV
jgi:hypothetical protein